MSAGDWALVAAGDLCLGRSQVGAVKQGLRLQPCQDLQALMMQPYGQRQRCRALGLRCRLRSNATKALHWPEHPSPSNSCASICVCAFACPVVSHIEVNRGPGQRPRRVLRILNPCGCAIQVIAQPQRAIGGGSGPGLVQQLHQYGGRFLCAVHLHRMPM